MTPLTPEPATRRPPHAWPVLGLILLPILANALVLTGAVNPDPALQMSGLASGLTGGYIQGGGADWLDPTIGILTQNFGALSARDWLHGIIPWWNPYTAVGMPLAAEMQSDSFFLPFVFLLLNAHGWIALRAILEICSGLGLYALLVGLEFRRVAAFVPAALFALNGTFFLDPHAMGPVPLLPLLLLGVEHAARAARGGTRRGWGLIPFAVAYSIYAGYPEVAYLDGLLAALWAIWRFAGLGPARWAFAGKTAGGAALGLCLALPLVLPFFSYVGQSYLGSHKIIFALEGIAPDVAPITLFPFIYGPIGVIDAMTFFDWYDLGGWFGLPAAVLALAALVRPRNYRGLAYLLAAFVIFWLLRCWSFPPAIYLADHIPFVARTDAVRFIWPALELAVFILAGIGIDSWLSGGPLKPAGAALIAAAIAGLILAVLHPNIPVMHAWYARGPRPWLQLAGVMTTLTVLAAGITGLLLTRRPTRRAVRLGAALVVLDACATAFIPQLSAPRGGHIDRAGIAYLQTRQGLARFYTLNNPFGPDYPARYGLASINDNALPVTQAWADYLHQHLDPNADVVLFNGSLARPQAPGAAAPPDQADELRRHLSAYEDIGVKYVLSAPDDDPFVQHAKLPDGVFTNRVAVLGPGHDISGTVPAAAIALHGINGVAALMTTYGGTARGTAYLTLCTATDCAHGSTDLSRAAENEYAMIALDHDLQIPPAGLLRYTLSHPAGTPAALWLFSHADGQAPGLQLAGDKPGISPDLRFFGGTAPQGVTLVFQNAVMRIYQLPRFQPFFSAAPACELTARDWNRVTAQCGAPARLTRLEAWYPGWHASVNGNPVSLHEVRSMFQAIDLPAGQSRVVFDFIPNGIGYATAIALGALLAWITLMNPFRKSPPVAIQVAFDQPPT